MKKIALRCFDRMLDINYPRKYDLKYLALKRYFSIS